MLEEELVLMMLVEVLLMTWEVLMMTWEVLMMTWEVVDYCCSVEEDEDQHHSSQEVSELHSSLEECCG